MQTLVDLYDTIMLFYPALFQPSVPDSAAQANLQFLLNDSFIEMELRDTQVINIPAERIKSGDFFGIIRLDGLDPMLAWAMGGTHTGHTTIALWIDGVLNVCESTTKDGYWPTNGVQCTEYTKWLKEAQAADHNVVYVPLSAEARALFDENKAVLFVKQNMGLNYGFGNILWGWIDSENDNYPYPLTWQAHEVLPALISKISPQISDLLWNQAFNFRIGTKGLNTADIYQELINKNMTFGQFVSIPEQDDWEYVQINNDNQTVSGRSMVCNVFVCAVWKAAGIFQNMQGDFQCAESTNWDIYALNIFDSSPPAPECQAADPQLPFCQILGKYRLRLPFYNSRPIVANAFNNCPRGNPPDFNKPFPC